MDEHAPGHSPPRRGPLRLKVIACEVLARQVYQRAAISPHVLDVELLEKRLHEDAASLRAELQRRIDATPIPPYDAIVLVYGLCNRATEGLVARAAPLAIARAHDCITLYLGSRERYAAQFQDHPGTYYYSAEYLERGKDGRPVGVDTQPAADEGMAFGSRMPAKYEELVRKYGEDNARYLAEVYGSWHQHYDRAAFIRLPCARCPVSETEDACAHATPFRERAVSMAARHGWEFAELPGSLGLLHQLLDGEWTPDSPERDDVLVVPPGLAIQATFDERVVTAAPPG
ncbi:MAG TPA: DUF1638 domain-containing protein [Chloroflexota bacterium]|nr:DUF1638 domain-containing protein [Chloroflexota bacterium]